MKTCEERTRDVLERRARALKQRRRLTAGLSMVGLCLVLTVGLFWRPFSAPDTDMSDPSPVSAADYEEIYQYISDNFNLVYVQDDYFYGNNIQEEVPTVEDATPAPGAAQPDGTGTTQVNTSTREPGDELQTINPSESDDDPDYSDTNLQVAGVQEADIVKTDGRYIYTVNDSTVSIIGVNNGALTLQAQFNVSGDRPVTGMYVTEDRLILEQGSVKVGLTNMGAYGQVYDITDRTAPKLLNTFGQSGNRNSSRMIGDILYTVTTYVLYQEPEKNEVSTYVPQLSEGGTTTCAAADDILLSEESSFDGCTYIVVTGYDTKNARRVSQKSLLGYGGEVYCSTTNLYVTGSVSLDAGDGYKTGGTRITRFALNDGTVTVAAQGTVYGTPLNQFSMDEYDGHFRLVTTMSGRVKRLENGVPYVDFESNQTQTLYVLDMNLQPVGLIGDLAPGERVYSVRFDGTIGYFVTFRQTDPLFTADLSDPQNPKILSELKIPGFSEYLHPYGDGLLFGLGRDTDENGIDTGCIKLSMFDVADPTDVTEAHTLVLTDCCYTTAEHNHKAILIDAGRDLIAFPDSEAGSYRIYGYDSENGFTLRVTLSGLEEFDARGLYIGDYFYVITAKVVYSYDMNDSFVQVGTLSLSK